MLILKIYCFIVGLCIGSFLSVCIHRIPRSIRDEDELRDAQNLNGDIEESEADLASGSESGPPRPHLTFGSPRRSCCPECGNQLKLHHNIPVLSWIFLGGKCAFCKAPIPFRYPLVELITGLLALVCLDLYGPTSTALAVFIFGCSLIVISVIDFDYFIIPNVISYPFIILGFALALLNQFTGIFAAPMAPDLMAAALGFLVGTMFLWIPAKLFLIIRKKEGMGFGDVKLLGMTGAFFGPACAFYTIFLGSLAGTILGVFLIILGKHKLSRYLPFGPYLAVGTMYYIIAQGVLHKYGVTLMPTFGPGL